MPLQLSVPSVEKIFVPKVKITEAWILHTRPHSTETSCVVSRKTMRTRHSYRGKSVSCMQLFYRGVPHEVVTCEANIHYQYIYKHKIILIIFILGTFSWSTLEHQFQKLKMVYLILKFFSAMELRSSSKVEQKPVTWPQHQPVEYILQKLIINFFWEPVQ